MTATMYSGAQLNSTHSLNDYIPQPPVTWLSREKQTNLRTLLFFSIGANKLELTTSIVPWRNPDTRTIPMQTENVAIPFGLYRHNLTALHSWLSSWRPTTHGRSQIEATTSFVIIRRAQRPTNTLATARSQFQLILFQGGYSILRHRHKSHRRRCYTSSFKDSRLLQEFSHRRITTDWTTVTIAPALHVVNFQYVPWPRSEIATLRHVNRIRLLSN